MTPRERWNALNPRERLLVAAAALVVALALGYAIVWKPIVKANLRLQQEVTAARSLAGWLRGVEAEVSRLRGAKSPTTSGGSLLNLVDQSSKAAGLASFVERLQPEGDAEVRIWFEQVPYEEFMRWTLGLELDNSVKIAELAIGRSSNPGMVSARLILRRGA